MTYYQDYTFNLLDRMELKYSIYVAALDVQYNHDLPYLWTFTFDLTSEIIFGRTWDHLNQFIDMLHDFGFSDDHRLLIYLDDLTQFFCYAKKIIKIDDEMLAKSPHDILIFTSQGLEFRDFQAYTEKSIDKLIYINDVNADQYHNRPDDPLLSAQCQLTDDEIQYSSRRVLEMTNCIRRDVDMIYQGSVSDIKITKTRRIENMISANMRRSDPDRQLYWLIHSFNPLSSEFGLNVLLPQLRKAFFGGTVFYENGVLNELIKNVDSADLVSAYCAEFVLSRFPMSKFKILDVPNDYHDLLTTTYYKSKALLIQFCAKNVKLKKNGLPILPAAMKHYYIDEKNRDERIDAIHRAQTLKLHESKLIRMCLTDIDFELFCRYYDFDPDVEIYSVMGARYGYLPDYIIKTVAELYKNKMIGKEKKRKLKKLGLLDPLQDEMYNDLKSAIARLYGIFTQSPVLPKYRFNQEKQDMELVTAEHLNKKREYSPVVYQWGVWTTALVRRKLCGIRDMFRSNRIRTLSGDTDCINFRSSAAATKIITDFNQKINTQIERRCKAIGLDPNSLQDLGTLEIENYKLYRITSIKQYAYIRESDSGDVFNFVCGGMNKQCSYFNDYLKSNHYSDPKYALDHFRIGLSIPAEFEPRKITRQCSGTKKIKFTDRDGNKISDEISSYQIEQNMPFRLGDQFASDFEMINTIVAPTKSTAESVICQTAAYTARIKTKTPGGKQE